MNSWLQKIHEYRQKSPLHNAIADLGFSAAIGGALSVTLFRKMKSIRWMPLIIAVGFAFGNHFNVYMNSIKHGFSNLRKPAPKPIIPSQISDKPLMQKPAEVKKIEEPKKVAEIPKKIEESKKIEQPKKIEESKKVPEMPKKSEEKPKK